MRTSFFGKGKGPLLTLLALALALPLHAQFDTGQISGFVRDPQGGVVPGATVKITSNSTNVARSYVTDGSGYYVAPALPPGIYKVEVQLVGFRTHIRTGIT